MDILTFTVVLVPSTLAIITSIVNIILSTKREARRKEDVVWETAKEIVLKSLDEECYKIESDTDTIAILNCFANLRKGLLAVKGGTHEQFLKEYKELLSKEVE